ncbi:MAG TPA: cation:proton antiporter [Candidatus Limnocylindrales bacterium]|jgi:K+:H+ antiporter|nr:cation:proton antiporter [Candidatus Limnocylindrales bacterium]
MEADPRLFRDLTYIFLAAVIGGLVARWLKLPLILGFVAGGIVLSPFTPGPQLSDLHAFEVFAEVGVVLLMFSIGVEFSLEDLLRVKWIALGGGALGICFSMCLAIAATWLEGITLIQGLIIGAMISVASTMVLARFLTSRGAFTTSYGRVMIGITLVEDIAVVLMTVVIPLLSGSGEGRWKAAAWAMGKAILLLVPLAFLAMKVVPPVLRKAMQTNDPELFLLVAIAICLVSAGVAQMAGFSVALGAFLAGFSISGAKDLHQTHTTLAPLRDTFVAMFFVSLGTLVVPKVILHNLDLLGTMLLLILVGKFGIWFCVMKLFRYSKWTSIAVAAGLTQIGELSFVLAEAAKKAGLIGQEIFGATLAASLISIFLNVLVLRVVFQRIEPKLAAEEAAAA